MSYPSFYKLHAVNPEDAYRDRRCLVSVSYGDNAGTGYYLLCWGHAEEAVEAAIQWCGDNAPDLLCSDEVDEEYNTKRAQLIDGGMDPDDAEEPAYEAAIVDTIYADPGLYILAHNVGIVENPSRAQLLEVKERIAR